MGELLWKIKRGGLIATNCIDEKMKVVLKRQYCSIRVGCEEFDGVRIKTYRWVPMVHPFNEIDLSWRLLVDLGDEFYDGDFKELADNRSIGRSMEVNRVIRRIRILGSRLSRLPGRCHVGPDVGSVSRPREGSRLPRISIR
jgi:hypothetical protein